MDKLLDELLQGKTPEEILGRDGLLKGLTKRLVERALEGEMTTPLGYEKHAPEGRNSGNSRNGATLKSVLTGEGELEIEVPRDRNAEFDPQLVKKGQRRLPGFDDKVIALYARGLTTREIQSHLVDIYGVEVSPTLISNVTDAVLEDVRAWQSRPLDPVYPIVYLDAIHLKLRASGAVQNQAVYVALGVNLEGQKDLLGLWIGETEGAKFWLNVLTELRNRGVRDILIACVDGLKGFPDAIENLYPQTQVQLCIVHMVRNSLRYVSWKERKAIARDLRSIYAAPTAEAAEQALEAFAARWDKRFPSISRSWRENWQRVIPFFAYPPEIRKVIYTTNAIESINASLRKVTRKRGAFPNPDSVRKVLYLAIQKAAARWSRPIKDWAAALNHFSIVFEGRVVNP
ncbi:MAG: transposase [Gammaproteobacteria bacterium RBG_16_66_13]|nr:MAG: transposase [Gammaproteobacteria bacterium RBG_16_66_13]